MGFFDFIIAIILAILGSVLSVYFVWVIVRSLLNIIRGVQHSPSKAKPNKSLKKADLLIERSNYQGALKVLESALLLRAKVSRANTQAAAEHNQAVLSRVLIINEKLRGGRELLPAVEKLFAERSEYQMAYAHTYEAFRGIQNKRKEQGKEIPNWGVEEHKKKLKSLDSMLRENEKELKALLKRFFAEIRASKKSDVTYHWLSTFADIERLPRRWRSSQQQRLGFYLVCLSTTYAKSAI